ncbi:MAG: replication protein [Streptococcus infantarius]|nr:replication protein [Streptococcus infantarius]
MTKNRSSKWAFLLYEDSAPENYLEVLENIQVPFILSPWHDRDIDSKTKSPIKKHKHGALFFESLKSENQVSELLTENLNTPKVIQPVHSPKGMYDYFTHAQNPEKTLYNINDIETGCGFDLEKFLIEQGSDEYLSAIIDIIDDNNFKEFEDLVQYARHHDGALLGLIMERTYFFTKYLDSRRYNPKNSSDTAEDETNN